MAPDLSRFASTVEAKKFGAARPGGIFGEMAIVDNRERSAGARAITTVDVAAISQSQFLHLLRTHPTFSIEVMGVMTDRLRLLNQALL